MGDVVVPNTLVAKFQITLLGASRTQTLRGRYWGEGVRGAECQVTQGAGDWNSGDQDGASVHTGYETADDAEATLKGTLSLVDSWQL